MRNKFDEQLHSLDEQLTHMGELCETAIAKATQALKDGSKEQAKIIITEDEEIDQIEKDIERLCLKLLLQQQRLCIARALAVEPEVLLMDEPTSALDPISTMKIEDLAVELKKDYTIIMVTHNMQQAARISDRTAFFLLGEVIEYADTETLFSMPKDKRTEDYITGRFG